MENMESGHGAVLEIDVPGRVCLFGEHSDWAGGYRRFNSSIEKGYCLVTGTDQVLHAHAQRHPNKLIITACVGDSGIEKVGPYELDMDDATLLEHARSGGFWSYAAGVAYQVKTFYPVGGLVLNNYKTTLPIKKGLSSSAAICVLVARAFNQVYNLKMTIRAEMEMAYLGEILTPSRCGRMDQCCAFGKTPTIMTFDGDLLQTEELSITKPMHLVIVDLCASKDTMVILNALNKAFPIADSEQEQRVQEYLGKINKGVVLRAKAAIVASDAQRVGELMTEAQTLFDEYLMSQCPQQLSSPVLHKVLAHPTLQPHVWGGKGVGAQGDGTAQFVCKSLQDQDKVLEILQSELCMPGLRLTLGGASPVRTAVIPCAGDAPDLYPASKAMPLPMFPIPDVDGMIKPAIVINVEEAFRAGVERVVLVVRPDHIQLFKSLFHEQLSIDRWNALPSQQQEFHKHLLDMGKRVHFALQTEQRGFGHAVLAAADIIGTEPFLLLLGDHLYRSGRSSVSCAAEIVASFKGHSVIGLHEAAAPLCTSSAVVKAEWLTMAAASSPVADGTSKIIRDADVTAIVEKPTIEYARSHLRTTGMAEDRFLMAFGIYVASSDVIKVLKTMQTSREQAGQIDDPFEFTAALEEVRHLHGLSGAVLNGGRRFDFGSPQALAETTIAWSTYRDSEEH